MPLAIPQQIWDLVKRNQKLLAIEEASWCLKSRAIWLKEGDKNTKFFHRFTNKLWEANTIWEIKNEEGISYTTQEAIAEESVKYFKWSYNRNVDCDIEDILWGIDSYPSMFDSNQNNILYSVVSEEELLATMKSFQKINVLVWTGGLLTSSSIFLTYLNQIS